MLELQAINNNDTWHMAQEKYMDLEESYRRIRVKTSASQLRKLIKKEMTLSDDKINKIASLSKEDYWPIEQTMGSNYGCNKAHTRMDGSDDKAINKPDLERSPGNQHDEDHKIFDSLDKEFKTQWEGYNPNMEVSHELPETSQYKAPSEENE